MSGHDLVSVITPVYNCERFIEKQISSILEQTYKNIELILIDDGSIDGTADILEKYRLIDSRIRVVSKINEGQSIARNVGLSIAKGKYISFVDGDDWLHPEMIEKMHQVMEDRNADISFCDFTSMCEGRTEIIDVLKFDIIKNSSIRSRLWELLLMPVVWNKMFRHDLLKKNNIYFPERLTHEDIEFLFKAIFNSRTVVKINSPLYFYRKHLGSLTSKIDKKSMEDNYIILKNIKDYLVENSLWEKEKLGYYKIVITQLYGYYFQSFKKQSNVEKRDMEIIGDRNKSFLNEIGFLSAIKLGNMKVFIMYLLLKYNLIFSFQRVYSRCRD